MTSATGSSPLSIGTPVVWTNPNTGKPIQMTVQAGPFQLSATGDVGYVVAGSAGNCILVNANALTAGQVVQTVPTVGQVWDFGTNLTGVAGQGKVTLTASYTNPSSLGGEVYWVVTMFDGTYNWFAQPYLTSHASYVSAPTTPTTPTTPTAPVVTSS